MAKSAGTSWFAAEEKKSHYWGVKRERIDLTRDENGNWYEKSDVEKAVRFDTFDMSRVPILLIRYIPYCPECMETVMMGFFNYEKDPNGDSGFAFRHVYHFWYDDQQMWGYPIPVRPSASQPGVQGADLAGVITESSDGGTYTGPLVTEGLREFAQGKAAFANGTSRWRNPYDGRKLEGRMWTKGWEAAELEAQIESQEQGNGGDSSSSQAES